MILKLNNLSVTCIIGERPHERLREQILRLDIELDVSDRAAMTDDLDDTVDYAALAARLREVLATARCQMIERAARLAAETCLADGKVRRVTVTVTKSGAIPELESAAVICTLEADETRRK